MNPKFTNGNKIQTILVASLLGAVFAAAAYAIGVNGTATTTSAAFTTDEQERIRPSPPPAPLQMWGSEVDREQGREQLGFDRLSEPADIPEGLVLKSTRATVSEDGTYRLLAEFYGPESIDSSDNAYIDDFLRNGGLMIVYVEDDLAKPFNWKELGPQLVNEAPEKREMRTVNDADALIVRGDKEQKEKSEVMYDIDRTRIAVVSNSYSADELLPIARSIRG